MKIVYFTFLLLLCGGSLAAQPLSQAEDAEARRLFAALGCQACHDFDKSGSNLAPPLDRIGLKLSQEQILERLQRPPGQTGAGKNFMPAYDSTPPEQLKLLSRFLAGRK